MLNLSNFWLSPGSFKEGLGFGDAMGRGVDHDYSGSTLLAVENTLVQCREPFPDLMVLGLSFCATVLCPTFVAQSRRASHIMIYMSYSLNSLKGVYIGNYMGSLRGILGV